MRKVEITKKRTIHTYAELWQGSAFCLQVGRSNPQGASWHFLSSVLLTAFSFEAYMNHVGPEAMDSWPELEKLSPLGKLQVLAEALSIKLPAAGKRPAQTLRELFQFRNTVAHGRSAELKYEPVIRTINNYQNELHEPLLADWERLIRTDKFAVKVRADAEDVMQLVQSGCKEAKENLFTTGFGHGSANLLRET